MLLQEEDTSNSVALLKRGVILLSEVIGLTIFTWQMINWVKKPHRLTLKEGHKQYQKSRILQRFESAFLT